MIKFLEKRSTFWIFLVLAGVFQTILGGVVLNLASPLQFLIFQTTYSPEVFNSVLEAWGPLGVSVFIKHFALDFIHPFLYSTFFAAALLRIQRLGQNQVFGGELGLLLLSAFAAGFCDELENIGHLTLALKGAEAGGPIFYAAATFARIKWALVGGLFFALLFGWIRLWALKKKGTMGSLS